MYPLNLSLLNKKNFILVCKIAVSGLVIWFLITTSLLQFKLLIGILLHPAWLLGALFIFLVMLLINTWRWYRLNSAQNIQLGLLKTSWITYLSTAFNNILPGNVGGDVVRTYYLFRNMPQQKSKILLSIMFDRVMGLMGIFTVIFCIIISKLYLIPLDKNLLYIFLICAGFCIVGLSIIILSILLPQKVGLSTWLSRRFPHQIFVKSLLSFLDAIRVYRNCKLILLECLLASILIQLLMMMTILIIVKMLNFPMIHPTDYLIAIGITQIANLIPAAPGGLGIGEAAFSKILIWLNPAIPAAYATIFIAYRLIGILVYLPGILGSMILVRR
ncbi:MAG: hypothetical protein A3F11_07375 [Gammaproteobacteria bacterium RIFCSPHIGHO2_12_FULL_37_14]|nr:MAG: hypothetical protein A3F11_07375 [Gammaproteobacteria bacterium RIFCSPHIGHO2_12_FULL_37_14]